MELSVQPLTREDVKQVIEGRGCAARVPLLIHKWVYPEAFTDPERRAAILNKFADAMDLPPQ